MWWLKPRMIGKCPMLTATEIVEAAERNGKVELTLRTGSDTSRIVTDHVLAATGYEVDIGRLSYLDQDLRSAIKAYNGAPVLNSVYESSVPGLHFVGISAAFTFGPVMRFVHGTKHPAHTLAAHIRSVARRPSEAVKLPLPARKPAPATFNPRWRETRCVQMGIDLATGARFLAWTVLSVIVALSYVPPAWRIVTGASHGAEHFTIFLLAGGFFALGYRRNLALLGVFAVALSGLLELLQLFVPGRHARMNDFAINALAACVGIAAVWLFERAKRPG